MRGCRYFLLSLAIAVASPATAGDITATYQSTGPFPIRLTSTIELTDNGDTRYQMSSGPLYGLVKNKADYFVELTPLGPIVTRAEDQAAVIGEAARKMGMTHQFGETEQIGPKMSLVQKGTMTINGRTGRAYYVADDKGQPIGQPFLVISDDPQLKPLGDMFANQFDKSTKMLGVMLGEQTGSFDNLTAVLRTGAPLRLLGMQDLVGVSTARIDPSRLDLPAVPLTVDQLRTRYAPLPPPPTAVMPTEASSK